jgi:alpha-amylase
MEVNTDFWQPFLSAAGDSYMVGEVLWEDPSYTCTYQNHVPGLMNYPTYFPLREAFSSTTGNISALADSINTVKSTCKDTSLLGSFSENHDQPRFAFATQDMSLAKNLITYTMLADGIPIIYQGQEQHYAAVGSPSGNDPYNREALWLSGYNTSVPLYQLVKKLNAIRKFAISDDDGYLSYQNWPIYHDDTTIAVRKGKVVSVLSNKGEEGDAYTQSIPAGYGADVEVTELLSCETLTANGDGNIMVPMESGLPRVYYPSSSLDGSGLC